MNQIVKHPKSEAYDKKNHPIKKNMEFFKQEIINECKVVLAKHRLTLPKVGKIYRNKSEKRWILLKVLIDFSTFYM